MSETEGVIKYQLEHQTIALDTNLSLGEINAWRIILFKLELIGQIEGRYEGYGFGNISQRIKQHNLKPAQFIISGTQTGGIESLTNKHYSLVLAAYPDKNSIISKGECRPSSEALTHASVYQQNYEIQAVIHVHCPEIWHNTDSLKLAHTKADIAYGTPEMATEVERLFQTSLSQDTGIFSMLGHQDGIIAYSDSIEKAACLLIKYYALAIS